jgi:hypothetical protein
MIRFSGVLVLALVACSPQPTAVAPPAEPSPEVGLAGKTTNLKDLQAKHDWQHEAGETVNASWNDGVKAILAKMSRPDAIKAITDAGFECEYGEAHPDYPDPMAVCKREFATRACQMTWEISSTADKGMVDEVDGSFKRDCVGTDQDWPDKVVSPIDNQLAPPSLPPPQSTAPSN